MTGFDYVEPKTSCWPEWAGSVKRPNHIDDASDVVAEAEAIVAEAALAAA